MLFHLWAEIVPATHSSAHIVKKVGHSMANRKIIVFHARSFIE